MPPAPAPRILSLQGRPADDSGAHPVGHVTVERGQKVLLSYATEGVERVRLCCATGTEPAVKGAPLPAGPGQSIEVEPAEDCAYSLVGLDGDAEVATGGLVLVDVYEPGALVAAVAFTLPPAADSPLAEYPLLLCGPMLRRVESQRAPGGAGDEGSPGHVCVFVATQQACKVRLQVFAGGAVVSSTTAAPLATAEVLTTPLGPCLHLALVDARGLVLAPGEPYSYDVTLQPLKGEPPADDGAARSLQDLGLLDGTLALGYHPHTLPSFLAPPAELERLRLAHGSCRKLHGQGEDAFVLLDAVLARQLGPRFEQALGHLEQRPHQLLLTGDQIYADDVPIAFCKLARQRAQELLCDWSRSTSRVVAPDLRFLEEHFSQGFEPGEERAARHQQALVGLESGLPGHLWFLGEFFATYLLAFSPALWPKDAAGCPRLPPEGADAPGARQDEFRFWKAAGEFARRAGAARRVLANVPTLMICDDHEVTNNWNLNREWVVNLRRSPLARRLVRNALCAYALFQDWGNRPEVYASGGEGAAILEALRLRRSEDGSPLPALLLEQPALLDGLLLPPLAEGRTAGTLHFGYRIEFPSHRLVVLDTRTQREFPPGGKAGARLIDRAGLAAQLPLPQGGDQALPGGKLCVVVSAVPVVSNQFAEAALSGAAAFLGPAYADHESWPIHREGFLEVLARLAALRRVVVLSGDVHYAFSAQLTLAQGERTSRIVQFCASPFKNQNSLAAAVKLFSSMAPDPPLPQDLWTMGGLVHLWEEGWQAPEEGAAAKAADELEGVLQTAPDRFSGPGGDLLRATAAAVRGLGGAALGLLPRGVPEVAQLLADPLFAKARTALSAAFGDARVRVDFLVDPERDPERIRLGAVAAGDPSTPLLPLVNGAGTRVAVDFNNVALVTFRGTSADPQEAQQTLLWKLQMKSLTDPNREGGAVGTLDTTVEMVASTRVGHTRHVARLGLPLPSEVDS